MRKSLKLEVVGYNLEVEIGIENAIETETGSETEIVNAIEKEIAIGNEIENEETIVQIDTEALGGNEN